MSRRTLRVLLLEDSAADAELIAHELGRIGPRVVLQHVDSREGFIRALREFDPQVIISDHSMAHFDTIAALRVTQAYRSIAPFIVVTGSLDDQMIVTSVRAGADTVIVKDNLKRLGPAISAALEARQSLHRLTPRQLEVLRLLAEGVKSPDMARRLKVSEKTIESHRSQIMKRLGIHDLVGLVRLAARLGLIGPG